ncbi:MAG: stalk domain-containing protein [Defluviitaleaceae bacterium]|nr:stalk domain-containing protein [Defluviitaleaceae bacterium]
MFKKQNWSRLLALALSAIMAVGILPAGIFAFQASGQQKTATSITSAEYVFQVEENAVLTVDGVIAQLVSGGTESLDGIAVLGGRAVLPLEGKPLAAFADFGAVTAPQDTDVTLTAMVVNGQELQLAQDLALVPIPEAAAGDVDEAEADEETETAYVVMPIELADLADGAIIASGDSAELVYSGGVFVLYAEGAAQVVHDTAHDDVVVSGMSDVRLPENCDKCIPMWKPTLTDSGANVQTFTAQGHPEIFRETAATFLDMRSIGGNIQLTPLALAGNTALGQMYIIVGGANGVPLSATTDYRIAYDISSPEGGTVGVTFAPNNGISNQTNIDNGNVIPANVSGTDVKTIAHTFATSSVVDGSATARIRLSTMMEDATNTAANAPILISNLRIYDVTECPHNDCICNIEVYSIASDPTLGALSNATVADHPIFGATSLGATLTGYTTPNRRIELTARPAGNGNGVDISIAKLKAALDASPVEITGFAFSIEGTMGVSTSSTSAVRFIRQGGGAVSSSLNLAQTAVTAGTVFSLEGYVPIAQFTGWTTDGGTDMLRLGTNNDATNGQNITVTKFTITQEATQAEKDLCTDCQCPKEIERVDFVWGSADGPALHLPNSNNFVTSRGGDVSIVSTGSGNSNIAALVIDNVSDTDEAKASLREAVNTMLVLSPGQGSSANRAIWVWTDLAGDLPGTVGDPSIINFRATNANTFLYNANVDAGAIFRTPAQTNPIQIELPINLFYTPAAGGQPEKFANKIYVLATLNASGSLSGIEDYTGGTGTTADARRDHIEAITSIRLRMVDPPPPNRFISLNIGRTASEMSFTWWSPKGQYAQSVVEYAPYSSLVDVGGELQMPSTATRITAPTAPFPIPSDMIRYAFDVNRVTLTGLAANTKFAYRVGDGNAGNWSKIEHFNTYTPNDKQVIMVVGDPQVGNSFQRFIDRWQHGLDKAIARAAGIPGHGGIDFILSAGDNIVNHNHEGQLEAYLTPTHLRNIPVFTTVGNHDTNDPAGSGFEPNLGVMPLVYNWPNHKWLNSDPIPYLTESANYRGGGNHYFSYGDVLYISLNLNVIDIAAHRATIEEAVASHPTSKWRIATFHQDVFGNGVGHAAGMPGSGRQAISQVLYDNGIDLVINGHEHTAARSHFMRGTAPQLNQRPVSFTDNLGERLVYNDNPGVFVSPEGIPFITLGSVSDFPKYGSAYPFFSWSAWTDPPNADGRSQYTIMVIEGDTLSFETYCIPYDAAVGIGSDPEFLTSSFVLRKTATFDDLSTLRTQANAMVQNQIDTTTWNAFRAAITAANGVNAGASATAIHTAYNNLYDAYYALINTANYTALDTLVTEVAATLATAVEGPWEGQYPIGSILTLRTVYDGAPHDGVVKTGAAYVNSLRLATQAQIDAQVTALQAAYTTFLAGVSDVPRPWVDVHNIPATGEYTMNLVHWMADDEILDLQWTAHDNLKTVPRYFAHFTKSDFAARQIASGNDGSYTSPLTVSGAVRPDKPFGPANASGGRLGSALAPNGAAHPAAHVTKTHAGEWIRYELNVAQAGMYSLQLGARNPSSATWQVYVRDLEQNKLADFTVAGNHGNATEWATAPMIDASNTIYLPEGKVIIELVFVSDGSPATGPTRPGASGSPAAYPDGPNVDILTFQRVGDGTAPTEFPLPDGVQNVIDTLIASGTYNGTPTAYKLPLQPNISAGNGGRQRGWGMMGLSYEFGTVNRYAYTFNEVAAATHLVFEVAGNVPGSIDLVLAGGAAGTWEQIGIPRDNHYSQATRTVSLDISRNPAFAGWRAVGDSAARRIIASHGTDLWDEMNVISAWFILDGDYVPPERCEECGEILPCDCPEICPECGQIMPCDCVETTVLFDLMSYLLAGGELDEGASRVLNSSSTLTVENNMLRVEVDPVSEWAGYQGVDFAFHDQLQVGDYVSITVVGGSGGKLIKLSSEHEWDDAAQTASELVIGSVTLAAGAEHTFAFQVTAAHLAMNRTHFRVSMGVENNEGGHFFVSEFKITRAGDVIIDPEFGDGDEIFNMVEYIQDEGVDADTRVQNAGSDLTVLGHGRLRVDVTAQDAWGWQGVDFVLHDMLKVGDNVSITVRGGSGGKRINVLSQTPWDEDLQTDNTLQIATVASLAADAEHTFTFTVTQAHLDLGRTHFRINIVTEVAGETAFFFVEDFVVTRAGGGGGGDVTFQDVPITSIHYFVDVDGAGSEGSFFFQIREDGTWNWTDKDIPATNEEHLIAFDFGAGTAGLINMGQVHHVAGSNAELTFAHMIVNEEYLLSFVDPIVINPGEQGEYDEWLNPPAYIHHLPNRWAAGMADGDVIASSPASIQNASLVFNATAGSPASISDGESGLIVLRIAGTGGGDTDPCGNKPCTCCNRCGATNNPGDKCTCAGEVINNVVDGNSRRGGGGGILGVVTPNKAGTIVIPQTLGEGISVSNVNGATGANTAISNLRVEVTQTLGDFGTEGGGNVLTTLHVGFFSGSSAIARVNEPITIAVALTADLAGVNTHRIVAVQNGKIIGGNVVGNSFVFQTDTAGDYEVRYVPTLKRLTLTLGTSVITDLAGNAETQTMSVVPTIIDGRTLVPVRYLSYALGTSVDWNEETREVSLGAGGKSLTFTLGALTPEMRALGMDVPPMVEQGRTMVPLRFISEFFGAVVNWDAGTRTIEIIM